MKRHLQLACVTACLSACGDEDSVSPEERLQGKWGVESSTYECVEMFGFDGDVIEVLDFCELDDGSYGAQSTSGTFVVSGSAFTWEPQASSCAEVPASRETVQFTFIGDQLRLTVPSRVLLLERGDSKGSGAPGGVSVAYGCFDVDGVFVPRPIQPLGLGR